MLSWKTMMMTDTGSDLQYEMIQLGSSIISENLSFCKNLLLPTIVKQDLINQTPESVRPMKELYSYSFS